MKACIVGAGTSGVIAAKVFLQHGIAFDCFEKGSGIGGLWRFGNDNGASTCYRSLHINTSKRMMQLSDFPFPDAAAEYPSHQEILAYFESYCDHFGVREHIRFRSEVQHAERRPGGGWTVTVQGPEGRQQHDYDLLLVANGHHWDPRSPELPGEFAGIRFHAHHYVDLHEPHDLRGLRVVVVGSGNSAMDIVCELGQAHREGRGPARVFLSQRSGVWITPKVLGNLAQDKHMRHPMQRPGRGERFIRRWVPQRLRRWLGNAIGTAWVRMVAGDPQRFGLKPPRDAFSSRHPTVSQDIHARLIHGDIVPKGDIRRVDGHTVTFEDGSQETVDAIIQATGYNIRFPFLDPALISAPGNDIALFQRIFDPRYPDLAFVALVQPLCSMMPIAELQANLLADYALGRYALPDAAAMQAATRAYHENMKQRFTASASHTIQIDCSEYSHQLFEEWDAGRRRAAVRARTAAGG